MKILCVIDHFGSGGAQRQLVTLAIGLKARGHEVQIFRYHPEQDFFRAEIEQADITVHEVRKGRGFSFDVLRRLIRLLREESYDGVISFLDSPNVYAELASVLSPRTRLIVSERASHHSDENRVTAFMMRLLHGLADVVVANSRSHSAWLRRYPWLTRRIVTIYNGYPLPLDRSSELHPSAGLSLLVIGRIGPEKNGLMLIEALSLFHRKHGYVTRVSWVGKQDERPAGLTYRRRMDDLLEQYPEVQRQWRWLGERSDVPELLEQHYALIHPSLYEGLPNVVCEALVAGRPVLISNVCDHALLVAEGERGFLFDPHDPQSIADAIERLATLSREKWLQLCANARRYAEESLGVDRMVRDYEALMLPSAAQHLS